MDWHCVLTREQPGNGFFNRQLNNMQVPGNISSFNQLNCYLDRADAELQSVWALTLPILVYRGLMLAWALWLA